MATSNERDLLEEDGMATSNESRAPDAQEERERRQQSSRIRQLLGPLVNLSFFPVTLTLSITLTLSVASIVLAANVSDGPIGATGPQGATGSTGAVGATGAAGLQGPAGDSGPQGNTGATGLKGSTGATGLQGSAGDSGLKGSAGDSGPQGNTGPKGLAGDTGPPGDSHWPTRNNNTYYTNGNVGVGIAVPRRNLHIRDVMRLEPRTKHPAGPAAGDIFVLNTGNSIALCFHTGIAWVTVSGFSTACSGKIID